MENKTEMSLSRAWKEFKESLHYAVEAKKGKFSLNVYLNRLSDSIDAYIKEMQIKENSQFQSGYIEVSTERDNVTFSIHLNFVEQNSTTTEKILCKSIPLSQFTDNTLSELKKGKKIYAVDAPKE
ncbi:MAG TPA: hypothetical protein DCG08_03340 [Dialister sp.]|nr:hypothetical protein [Dialister sp.]